MPVLILLPVLYRKIFSLELLARNSNVCLNFCPDLSSISSFWHFQTKITSQLNYMNKSHKKGVKKNPKHLKGVKFIKNREYLFCVELEVLELVHFDI